MPWISLGGTSRRYRNTDTGNEISRTQYDKLYGRLVGQGFSSKEHQAKVNRERDIAKALARPARGRRSLLRASEAERQARVIEYQLEQQEKLQRKGMRKSARAAAYSLPKGKRGIRFSLPFDLEEIWKALEKGLSTPGIIGAGVGVEGYSTADNTPIAFTAYGAFLLSDFKEYRQRLQDRITLSISNLIQEKSYFIPNGFFVWFTWSIDWLRRYRNWK